MERVNRLKEIYKTIDSGTAEYKMQNLPKFPKIIEFEVTNHCNFQCLMCKTGVGTSARERGYMSDEVFDRVIEEIKDYPIALKFVGLGEPLLHPRCIDYIKKAKANGIIVHLTTNASLLDESMMRELVEAKLDSIKFSFQGVDREGYLVLRQKDNYEELLKKIESLYTIRGDKEFPYITIGTSVTDEEKEKVEDFRIRCSKISDKVEIGITTLEFIDLDKIKSEDTRNNLRKLQENQNRIKQRYVCCPQIFDTIAVRWNGDVTACCADSDGIMTLGNVLQNSILECWNSPLENKYREILSNCEYDKLELCRDCYDVYGWTYGDN